jgi:hypothetical protein
LYKFKIGILYIIIIFLRGYSSMVERLYVAQYVPCSNQGIHHIIT